MPWFNMRMPAVQESIQYTPEREYSRLTNISQSSNPSLAGTLLNTINILETMRLPNKYSTPIRVHGEAMS
jgi:hypothetical protein